MKSFILLLLLLAPQANPTRVTIFAETQGLATLFHVELKKRHNVAVVEKDAEFAIYLATAKLEDCEGFTATVLIVNPNQSNYLRMFIADAPTLRLTLERAAAKMDFQLRRIYPSTRH